MLALTWPSQVSAIFGLSASVQRIPALAPVSGTLPFAAWASSACRAGYEARSCSRFHRSKSFMPPEMADRITQYRMYALMAAKTIDVRRSDIGVIHPFLGSLGRLTCGQPNHYPAGHSGRTT